MSKKLILTATLVTVISAASITYAFSNNRSKNLKDLQLASVEALTENEISPVKVKCDDNPVIICRVTCSKCHTRYTAINGHGKAYNFTGVCSCGSSSFYLY